MPRFKDMKSHSEDRQPRMTIKEKKLIEKSNQKKSQLNLLKYVHKYIYCILKLCFYHFESDRRFLKKKFCDEKFCDEKVFIILGQPVLRFSKKCSLFWDKKVFIILGHHCTV